MDPERVRAIARIPPESINTISAVRSFVGACSFWRKHTKDFARICKPLTDLTKAGVDVPVESQKEPAQQAIRKLKDALCSAPVSMMPLFDREMILMTDASITGLGAVICQRDDAGCERPLRGLFSSRVAYKNNTQRTTHACTSTAVKQR